MLDCLSLIDRLHNPPVYILPEGWIVHNLCTLLPKVANVHMHAQLFPVVQSFPELVAGCWSHDMPRRYSVLYPIAFLCS